MLSTTTSGHPCWTAGDSKQWAEIQNGLCFVLLLIASRCGISLLRCRRPSSANMLQPHEAWVKQEKNLQCREINDLKNKHFRIMMNSITSSWVTLWMQVISDEWKQPFCHGYTCSWQLESINILHRYFNSWQTYAMYIQQICSMSNYSGVTCCMINQGIPTEGLSALIGYAIRQESRMPSVLLIG